MYRPEIKRKRSGAPVLSRKEIDVIGQNIVGDFMPEALKSPQEIDIDLLAQDYLGMDQDFQYLSHCGVYLGMTVFNETVVLLSQQKPDDTIEIDLDLDELDATSAELKATYQEIKDYVLKEFGLKVSSLYISQVKRKCGIEVGENYNLPKSENARVPQCPKEKEEAIKAALKYFAMI